MIPLLACLLVIVFITDVRHRKIPNKFTIPCTLIGLVYHTVAGGWDGLKFSLLGCFVGFGLLTILYLLRAVGAGDVKLFAAIGAITGMHMMLYILFYAIIYAGIVGLAVVIARRPTVLKIYGLIYTLVCSVIYKEKRVIEETISRATRFPFMLAVMPAAITVFVIY